jgi:ABC-2 type transport system ATP-binding protein
MTTAIEIDSVRHRYGEREALRGVSLSIDRGEIFALLGPNGGGKTTLFKILATLLRPTDGTVRVLGEDLATAAHAVRPKLGVVFQNPGLDPKLTVAENLVHHGHLYGLGGADLRERIRRVLADLDLADRADDYVETLSGGLARRTELARGLLHSPELLLLDEPSTGLDPGARRDFGQQLRALRDRGGVTIVLTTHYMEEAERADRVAVLHQGERVALGTPDELKRTVGGDVVVVHAEAPRALGDKIRGRFGLEPRLVDDMLRLERERGHELVREIVEAFPG